MYGVVGGPSNFKKQLILNNYVTTQCVNLVIVFSIVLEFGRQFCRKLRGIRLAGTGIFNSTVPRRDKGLPMSAKQILNVTRTILLLVLEAPVRPRWAYYRLRGFLYNYYLNRFHMKRIGEYEERLQPLTDALAFCTGYAKEEVIAAGRSGILENMEVQGPFVVGLPGESKATEIDGEGPIKTFYGPSPEFMKTVHIVCRLLRPKIVIETGVGRGFTSAAILDALEQNGTGDLYSVELPSLYIGYAQQVGEIIPARLRSRWHLKLGPSALQLPRILENLGSVDVFVFDSAASYDNQITEFSTILARMRTGGVLIANLHLTDALIEVAETFGCRWTTTKQTKIIPIGLITKLNQNKISNSDCESVNT